jgi:class 3 adenylate cyclase
MGGALLGFAGRIGLGSGLKLQERWRLRRVFAGYVSPSILKEIVDGRIHPGLTGERRAVCLVFSDIRDFTSISEKLKPEEVIAILNRYFGRMAECIHGHGGTLDKFIGDGIMAFFGAPEPMENPCKNGFEAAKAMVEALETLNAEWANEGRKPLRIGIGLHYGEASVGHVGSESRHEYTAIGDAVNVASRVEGLTKETGYPLVCTDAMVQQLGTPQTFDSLGDRPLKGRKSIAVYGWPRRSDPEIPQEPKP